MRYVETNHLGDKIERFFAVFLLHRSVVCPEPVLSADGSCVWEPVDFYPSAKSAEGDWVSFVADYYMVPNGPGPPRQVLRVSNHVGSVFKVWQTWDRPQVMQLLRPQRRAYISRILGLDNRSNNQQVFFISFRNLAITPDVNRLTCECFR